jgi:hypothetical protein
MVTVEDYELTDGNRWADEFQAIGRNSITECCIEHRPFWGYPGAVPYTGVIEHFMTGKMHANGYPIIMSRMVKTYTATIAANYEEGWAPVSGNIVTLLDSRIATLHDSRIFANGRPTSLSSRNLESVFAFVNTSTNTLRILWGSAATAATPANPLTLRVLWFYTVNTIR